MGCIPRTAGRATVWNVLVVGTVTASRGSLFQMGIVQMKKEYLYVLQLAILDHNGDGNRLAIVDHNGDGNRLFHWLGAS